MLLLLIPLRQILLIIQLQMLPPQITVAVNLMGINKIVAFRINQVITTMAKIVQTIIQITLQIVVVVMVQRIIYLKQIATLPLI